MTKQVAINIDKLREQLVELKLEVFMKEFEYDVLEAYLEQYQEIKDKLEKYTLTSDEEIKLHQEVVDKYNEIEERLTSSKEKLDKMNESLNNIERVLGNYE